MSHVLICALPQKTALRFCCAGRKFGMFTEATDEEHSHSRSAIKQRHSFNL